jgi:tetratricopeptide (TPR) repeat protein/predicted Ser/Thr protein kinase
MSNDHPSDGHTLPHPAEAEPQPETVVAPPGDGAGDDDPSGRGDTTTFTPPAPGLPAVPGYVVTREVARGGMGVVYAARDPVFDRELAVKVMHPEQNAAQFVVEARVTAGLPHPGIPPVYALGELADGRPFLVMKLIRGRTLADELAGAGRADLPRLLDTFQRVCQTVGFAHACGIVHRDLKPSNIMVGSCGEVLVMDWGLACGVPGAHPPGAGRADGPAPPRFEGTAGGRIKGTPGYMAPEQARGEPVDARADVFALGGILAALLTGAPPFGADTLADAVLRAAQADLGPCFAALDACGADADLLAVARKCLAPGPADRYPTAAAVASAVSAYRTGVEQRWHRAERDRAAAEARAAEALNTRAEAEARIGAERAAAAEQRKRRRAQLAVAAALVLLLAGAGAFGWWRDKQTAERELADERTRAEVQRVEADARAAAAVLAADLLRVEMDARAAAARLAGERDAEARNKAEQARAGVLSGLALATDLRQQFKFKPAAAALVHAADLAASGAPQLRPEVERARRTLALVAALDDIRYRKWAWTAESGRPGMYYMKKAAAEYRQVLADHDLDLTALCPVDAAQRIAASEVRVELVTAVDDWALFEPDAALRDRLLLVARRTDPGPWTDRLRDPAVWTDRPALTRLAADADPAAVTPAALSTLAELMRRQRLNPAPLLAAARAKHPTDFELAFALGQWHVNNRDGLQIGPYEAARTMRPDNTTVLKNLGVALGWRGDWDGHIAAHREAIRLNPQDAMAHNNLCVGLREKGDLDGSLAAGREAVRLDPLFSVAHDSLGTTLALKKDRVAAIEEFRTAVRLDPQFARAFNNLGVALKESKDLDGAIEAYEAAVAADPQYAMAHNNLGVALHIRGDLDGAVREFREAVRINPRYVTAHTSLALVLQDKWDLDGAILAYKGAIKADPGNAQVLNNLGSLYIQLRRYPEAIECARAALEIDPKYAHAHATLGVALGKAGDHSGARAALTQAARLDPPRWGPVLAGLKPLEAAPPPHDAARPKNTPE